MTKRKPLSPAQLAQRKRYSAAMSTPKTNSKLRGVASALHRVTGLSANR